MIRRMILIAVVFALTACAAVVAPCAPGQDGGMGGTGTCISRPADAEAIDA